MDVKCQELIVEVLLLRTAQYYYCASFSFELEICCNGACVAKRQRAFKGQPVDNSYRSRHPGRAENDVAAFFLGCFGQDARREKADFQGMLKSFDSRFP